jgi:hypothetical protein
MSEKVAPGVHDTASKNEAFGCWKELWLHHGFVKREEQKWLDWQLDVAKREKEEHEERELHTNARSDMIMK